IRSSGVNSAPRQRRARSDRARRLTVVMRPRWQTTSNVYVLHVSSMSHLINLLQEFGLGLVFVNVLALQAGLPVPAYPVLIVAGAYAAMGGNPVWQLVLVGIAAALVADTGWYAAGRK